jgi:hypothetical protein
MKNEKPSYVAVIPANVRHEKRLKASEKILYSEILAITMNEGRCHYTNSYFAFLFNTTKNTVSKWVSSLVKYGYIKTEYVYTQNSQILSRIITLN